EASLAGIPFLTSKTAPLYVPLVARTKQQYRILLRGQLSRASFGGLRAVLYADAQPRQTKTKNHMRNAQHNFAREATFSKSLYSHSFGLPLLRSRDVFRHPSSLSHVMFEVSEDS